MDNVCVSAVHFAAQYVVEALRKRAILTES